jgi:hypothetical protein
MQVWCSEESIRNSEVSIQERRFRTKDVLEHDDSRSVSLDRRSSAKESVWESWTGK